MSARAKRKVALRVAAALVVVLAVSELVGLVRVHWQGTAYPNYWANRAAEPTTPDAVRVLVYGDSSAMGIGAGRPEDSIVGRIVRHVSERTGRPVHVVNRSSGGSGVVNARRRVDAGDVARADLVIVSAGSNDVGELAPAEFRRQLAKLVEKLPAERTVFSGIAPVRGWRPYQDALAAIAEERGVRYADVATQILNARRLDILAPDFAHLNSTGYRLWFEAFRPHVDALTADLR